MSDFKIIQKWEDMVVYGYTALKQYPKSEKYALGQETSQELWNLGSLLQRANSIRSPDARYRQIEQADYSLARLRVLIRAGHRLKFLPPKKYEYWSILNNELGKLIGGWMTATKKG